MSEKLGFWHGLKSSIVSIFTVPEDVQERERLEKNSRGGELTHEPNHDKCPDVQEEPSAKKYGWRVWFQPWFWAHKLMEIYKSVCTYCKVVPEQTGGLLSAFFQVFSGLGKACKQLLMNLIKMLFNDPITFAIATVVAYLLFMSLSGGWEQVFSQSFSESMGVEKRDPMEGIGEPRR